MSHLYDPFDNLISSYKRAEGSLMEEGTPILYLIQDEWDVFSERLVNADGAGRLLEAIMLSGWDDDSGESPLGAYDHYVTHGWTHDTLTDIWERFAYDVKTDPSRALRFRDRNFDEFLIREDLLGGRTAPLREGGVLFRARPGYSRTADGPKPWSGPDIGAPPPDRAGPGRAAPKGKVVLYCADQEGTAVAEVRPARGEYVSVAVVHAARQLSILDLATEPERPNPFTTESLNYWLEFAALVAAFAEELGKPLRSRDDLADYIPSQKLTELIEKAGADGIRYPSAMALEGTNVVLFRPSVAHIGPSRLVEIVDVQVQYRDAEPE